MKYQNLLGRLGPFLGLIFLFIAGGILNGDTFLNPYNQINVLGRISIIALPAIGMTLVIISAGIDLSVGSIVSLSSVICSMLLMQRSWTHATSFAVPIFVCFAVIIVYLLLRNILKNKISNSRLTTVLAILLAGFAGMGVFAWSYNQIDSGFSTVAVLLVVPIVGFLFGALNGLIIAKGRIQPFIVTLGMMSAAIGLAKFIAGKGGQIHPVYYNTAGYSAEGTLFTAPQSFDLLSSKIALFGTSLLPVPFLFFIMAAILAHVVLTRVKFGRYLYAIGGNEETARLSGINTDKVKVVVYGISGFLSALAGILYCSAYTQGKSDAGLTWELDAIAAVVIGGTSLMGGKGSVTGTVVGVLIIGYLSNILNLMEVSSELQDIMKGIIIVGAVLLQEGRLVKWLRKLTTFRLRDRRIYFEK
jgi:ribose/xylose/arabinose/galactoside ABC-type transport system permease subunit